MNFPTPGRQALRKLITAPGQHAAVQTRGAQGYRADSAFARNQHIHIGAAWRFAFRVRCSSSNAEKIRTAAAKRDRRTCADPACRRQGETTTAVAPVVGSFAPIHRLSSRAFEIGRLQAMPDVNEQGFGQTRRYYADDEVARLLRWYHVSWVGTLWPRWRKRLRAALTQPNPGPTWLLPSNCRCHLQFVERGEPVARTPTTARILDDKAVIEEGTNIS